MKLPDNRRYKDSKFPEYDNEYDYRYKRSTILKKRGNSKTVKELEQSILQIAGNKKGYYERDDHIEMACIPSIEQELSKILNQHKIWKQRQVQDGKTLTEPTGWPDDLLFKRSRCEAAIDIYKLEKSILEKHLKKLKETPNKDMLKNGLADKLIQKGSTSISVDGQRLSHDKEGRPFISEPQSPYNGMYLYHYRRLCKTWNKEEPFPKWPDGIPSAI